MPPRRAALLSRYPLLDTDNPALARETTARFWPEHEVEVLGPAEYALRMNRVELAAVALTYVSCTTRIRVRPSERCTDYTLYVPLRGGIEIVADGIEFTAAPDRPLLRAPARVVRFEASPIECLIVDLSAEIIESNADRQGVPSGEHQSLAAAHAATLPRLVMRLARAVDRDPIPSAVQLLPPAERVRRLPKPLRRLEDTVVSNVVTLFSGTEQTGGDRRERCDVTELKRWIARHATGDVRLAELARHAGVSQRTVQRAFLRTGCTPQEYLRSVRLDLVQRKLRAPARQDTVARIARAAGFAHLGRFSDAYRERFGELPSAALARSRGRDRR